MVSGIQVRWDLSPESTHHVPTPLLRHQVEAIQRLAAWWRDSSEEAQTGVLCLPTGAGKTRTAASFVLGQAMAGRSTTIWLANRTELCQGALQTFITCTGEAPRDFTLSRFERQGVRDVLMGDVVVASLPSLAYGSSEGYPNLEDFIGGFVGRAPSLIVVDECHHLPAPTWREVVRRLRERWPRCRLLGLSATPTRTVEAERRQLWREFHSIIHEEPVGRLIEEEVLARPTFEMIRAGGLRVTANAKDREYFQQFRELSLRLVGEIAESDAFNRAVVSTYSASRSRWGQTLVFVETKDHAHELARRFRQAGHHAEALVTGSDLSEGRRAQLLHDFRTRRFPVLINVGICTEGVDIPTLDSVFLARPTRSVVLTQQMLGRAMRGPRVGGKARCNAVVFYAEVVGLLDQILYSSFATEQELLFAAGLGEEAAAPTALPVTGPDSGGIDDQPGPAPVTGTGAAVPTPPPQVIEVLPRGRWYPLPASTRPRTAVGFFGKTNSGRSTLINAFLGRRVLDATALEDNQVPTRLLHSDLEAWDAWGMEGDSPKARQAASLGGAQALTPAPTMIDGRGPFGNLLVAGGELLFLETPALGDADLPPGVGLPAEYLPFCDRIVLALSSDQGVGQVEREFLEAWARNPRPLAIIIAAADRLVMADPASLVGGSVAATLDSYSTRIRMELERCASLVPASGREAGAAIIAPTAVGAAGPIRQAIQVSEAALWGALEQGFEAFKQWLKTT